MNTQRDNPAAENTSVAATVIEISWYITGLLIVAALGFANLYMPFGIDSTVHLLGAKAINEGAILYVDYWDNKAPGLYYFYVVAGRLFGFDEFGIHLFELLWLLLFSLCLILTLRPFFNHRWLAALVPACSVGIYYATVTENELTQLEFLVSLPIYLSLWCAYHASRIQKGILFWCFLSGVFASIAVLFKLVLGPMLAFFWLVLAAYLLYQKRCTWLILILYMALPTLVGLLIPLTAATWWFVQQGALDELLWTQFYYPGEAFASSPPASKTRLISIATFFSSYFAPWLLFIGLAVYHWCKTTKPVLITLMLTWLLAATVLLLIQSFSWWQYHALLFFTPSAILAIWGIDQLITSCSQQFELDKHLFSLLIAIPLCASLVGPFINKAKPLISAQYITHKGIHFYKTEVSRKYHELWQRSRFLMQPDIDQGPIYVFGHAGIYTLTGREPAHEIIGASWPFYISEQIDDILRTLKHNQVAFIFMDRDAYTKIPFSWPQISNFIQTHYEEFDRQHSGIWYIRQGLPKPTLISR